MRDPEPSARSAGASRSLQQRRPNQSPRSRRGQTSPETPPALLTAEGLAGARLEGSTARAHSEAPRASDVADSRVGVGKPVVTWREV